uniref:Xylulose kinase-1 n=1 Tax=Tanacetum cinerariifolium TaxID=118510 RepID=A0A699IS04_TANCI|nr:hypothetical protein [Tanacetum cinerariifolium]
MIEFLTKSDASKGFDQIVDFWTAHTIHYALMVNPTIYVSCIKQFWAFVSIKKFNDVVKLQALINKKKCMSAKRTAWNEFSSSMASAVICLATGVDTPLFDAMLVPQQVQDDVAAVEEDKDNEVSVAPTSPSPTPPPPQQEPIPSPPQAQSAQPSSPPQQQPSQTADISESSMTLLNTLMETFTTVTPITTATQVPKASNPRRKRGVVMQDPEEIAATSVIVHSEVQSKDKGKGIIIEEPKHLKGQAQINMDEAFSR